LERKQTKNATDRPSHVQGTATALSNTQPEGNHFQLLQDGRFGARVYALGVAVFVVGDVQTLSVSPLVESEKKANPQVYLLETKPDAIARMVVYVVPTFTVLHHQGISDVLYVFDTGVVRRIVQHVQMEYF